MVKPQRFVPLGRQNIRDRVSHHMLLLCYTTATPTCHIENRPLIGWCVVLPHPPTKYLGSHISNITAIGLRQVFRNLEFYQVPGHSAYQVQKRVESEVLYKAPDVFAIL